MMQTVEVKKILERIAKIRLGVLGDYCLDAYWETDDSRSELSVETGLPTRAVRTQRYSLGGAGNVAANLRAMGTASVSAYGVVGADPFGHQMRMLMNTLGIENGGLLTQETGWETHTYVKPIESGNEANRIDFGNFNRLSDTIADHLIARLADELSSLDVVIVNQQVTAGIHGSERFQRALQRLILANPETIFLLDSRDMSRRYAGSLRKINAYEAAVLVGQAVEPRDVIALDDAASAARALFAEWKRPVFLSRGDRGCLVVEDGSVAVVPGLHIVDQTDPVGAGDSMMAGIAAALAAGCGPVDAAIFGNFVAGVTVQKCLQTGTASPEEIRRIGTRPDYIYRPEKAEDPRQATYWQDTDIEVVSDLVSGAHRLTHAIFDHDGTISVLREGWESIMEPMMMRAILGPVYASADETTYHKVRQRVLEFIDGTTGIQTLAQMEGLVKLVRGFGFVPDDEIRDAAGYKAIYNQALLDRVRKRLNKFKRGELAVEDFVIKGSVEFLRRLHTSGVALYLASGSDREDVVAEARALGYADLFGERIYGAVGDVTREAKKIVMDRILGDIGADKVSSVAAFGDGPVEIRECRKLGGVAVGIASDEVRRFGMNPSKRRRLIRAGADLVVADFTQGEHLLRFFGMA